MVRYRRGLKGYQCGRCCGDQSIRALEMEPDSDDRHPELSEVFGLMTGFHQVRSR